MRLDRAVVQAGLSRSRSHAQELIRAGGVLVEGQVCTKASLEVTEDQVTLSASGAHSATEISRAQRKLQQALDLWPDVLGDHGGSPEGVQTVSAVDLGASTGGFTAELLSRGVGTVWAVDVGHGQLVDVLRQDERVLVREGVNARDVGELAEAGMGQECADLVVCDVSFISLTHVLPSIAWLLRDGGRAVVLVKPQFEVGPQIVSRGVVTSPQARRGAVEAVMAAAAAVGLQPQGLAASSTPGTHGNVEFLLSLARVAPQEVVPGAWHSELPDPTHQLWNGEHAGSHDI